MEFGISEWDFVSLKVYNESGMEVVNLVEKNLLAGQYAIKFDGSHLPSGVYYYKLSTENFSDTKKMILLK